MSRKEFIATWLKNGLELATFLASQLGVSKAQIELWKLSNKSKGI